MNLTPPPPTTPSFEKSAIPLSLIVKPSKWYLTAVVAFHLLALCAVFVAALPTPAQVLFGVVVAGSLYHNLVLARRTRRIMWYAGNRWTIQSANPDIYIDAQLRSADFLSRWLVILTLEAEDHRTERFVIPFDSVDKDSYRLLRVRLRIEGHRLINPTDSPDS